MSAYHLALCDRFTNRVIASLDGRCDCYYGNPLPARQTPLPDFKEGSFVFRNVMFVPIGSCRSGEMV